MMIKTFEILKKIPLTIFVVKQKLKSSTIEDLLTLIESAHIIAKGVTSFAFNPQMGRMKMHT